MIEELDDNAKDSSLESLETIVQPAEHETMALNETISLLLEYLCTARMKLVETLASANPDLQNLLDEIREVKRLLKDLEEEQFKAAKDLDDDARKESNKVVFKAMDEAENVLYPNDYSIDKLVFALTRDTDDEKVKLIDDYKKIVEFLTQIDNTAKLSNEKNVSNELSEVENADETKEVKTTCDSSSKDRLHEADPDLVTDRNPTDVQTEANLVDNPPEQIEEDEDHLSIDNSRAGVEDFEEELQKLKEKAVNPE